MMKSISIVCIIILLAVSLLSCQSEVEKAESAQSVSGGSTTEEREDDTDIAQSNDTTEAAPEDTVKPAPYGVGGGGEEFDDFYKYCFCSIGFFYVNSKGESVNFSGTFITERRDEVVERLDYYDQFFKDPNSCDHKNYMWYMVKDLELSREDIELYNSMLEDGSPEKLSEEDIDALFIEDEYEARDAMRSETTLFDGKDVYRIIDIEKMSKEEFLSHGFQDDDVARLISFFNEYADSFDYSNTDDPELTKERVRKESEEYVSLLRELSGI